MHLKITVRLYSTASRLYARRYEIKMFMLQYFKENFFLSRYNAITGTNLIAEP